jgi:excinuclease ABC subunit A
LHFEDVAKLLGVLKQLVDAGNSVIVIEHHIDVIYCADWVIDLGPEGGPDGGEIIAAGTPEAVAAEGRSHTGRCLKELIQRHAPPKRAAQKGSGSPRTRNGRPASADASA